MSTARPSTSTTTIHPKGEGRVQSPARPSSLFCPVSEDGYQRFWDVAAIRLVHPTQVIIIEAIVRIGRPLSPTSLAKISDETISLGSFDYHCKRLASLDLLEIVKRKQRRGAVEKFYGLPEPEEVEPTDQIAEATLDTFGERELDDLEDRVAHILRMRSRMWDGKQHTLKEVGDELGVGPERIRQLEGQGLLLIRQLREVQRHMRTKPNIRKLWKTRW